MFVYIKKYLFFFPLLLLFWTVYSFFKPEPVLIAMLSAGYGFMSYFIPDLIPLLYKDRRAEKDITVGNTVYDAFYSLMFKYMIFFLIFGTGLKFFHLIDYIIVFSMVITVFYKIIYISINKRT